MPQGCGVIAAPAARRIDRLLGRAHWRHRLAHHPLCDAYRPSTVRLGRWVLCRGCVAASLGAGAGFGVGLWLPVAPAMVCLALGTVAWLLAAVRPSRLPALVTRFLPVACLAAAAAAARHTAWLGVASCLAIGGGLWAYRRRGPDRSPCRLCPQRQRAVCDGFVPIVRRERAAWRLADRFLRTDYLSHK